MSKRKGSKVFRLERNARGDGMKARLFGGDVSARTAAAYGAPRPEFYVPASGDPAEAGLARSMRAIATALSQRERA